MTMTMRVIFKLLNYKSSGRVDESDESDDT